MPRFFVNDIPENPQTILITEDAHHIQHVLRMHVGEELTVCDGQGMDSHAQIQEFTENGVLCKVLSQEPSAAEPQIHVTLFQGLPKSDKMEWILQKGTELGISAFVPVAMQRSIAKYDSRKDAKKLDRWQKIAESAAKQSGRGRIPAVKETISLQKAADSVRDYDIFLVPYEMGLDHSLKACLQKLDKMPKTAAVLIGPEGGIDAAEVQMLEAAGARIVGLGPRILRTETAGIAAATMLLYHFDQMK